MFIKKLALYESYPEQKLIREITFKKGPNFIVDTKNKVGQRGNGVGKTTALKVLDICLGAKERKYVYTDSELDTENQDLKAYIDDSKIFAELSICSDLNDQEANSDLLRVDLYPNGRRFINEKQFGYDEYCAELNKLFFENPTNDPKFRQLMNMFVRVDQKGDNDKFLRFLHGYTTNIEYENVYSYLFKLTDDAVNQEVKALKEKIRDNSKDRKKLLSLNQITNIKVIEQRIIELDKVIRETKRKIAVLIDAAEMKKNEELISKVKNEYTQLAEQIDKYEFKSGRIRDIIESAKLDSERRLDTTVLKNLYNETRTHFAELDKTFKQLVDFNEQLITNKIKYFEAQLGDINRKLRQLSSEKEGIFERYKDVVVLIKDSNIEQYARLQNDLEELTKENGSLEKIKELYGKHTAALKLAEELLSKVDFEEVDPVQRISVFNDYFTAYTNLINHEGYMLHLTDEDFPVGISNVKSGLSTGTKKSTIAAFDLAFQSYASKQVIVAPKFFIHDVIETMDEVGLTNTVEISRRIGCQYIAAVLSDKIDRIPGVERNDKRLLLSDDNKLFNV